MKNNTVLLITSDANFIKVLKKYLSRKGINLIASFEEKDFIKKTQENQPNVIIVDSETEDVKPVFLCKRLKDKFPHVSLIALTVTEDSAHISKLLNIPIDDFLVKPIEPNILYMRIENILGPGDSSKKYYKTGNLKIDLEAKIATLNGKKLNLSPKEFRLLKFLMSNKGKVFSREAILNNVWGSNAYVIDRNVDVYIGYLRDKIGEFTDEEYIKTKPTFGYMVVDKD